MIRNQTTNTLRLGRFIKEYKSSGSSLRTLISSSWFAFLSRQSSSSARFQKRGRENGAAGVALSLIGALFLLPVVLGIYVYFADAAPAFPSLSTDCTSVAAAKNPPRPGMKLIHTCKKPPVASPGEMARLSSLARA